MTTTKTAPKTAPTTAPTPTTSADEIFDAIEKGERAGLEAVRRFVDTVDEAFPTPEGVTSPDRQKIIDSAFKMVEQLLTVTNDFARSITRTTEDVLGTRSGSD